NGTIPTPAPSGINPPNLISSGPTPGGIAFNVLPFPASPPPDYSSLLHFLVPGSGGGGGGSHPLFGLQSASIPSPWCAGGGGGGGGGALAIRTGGTLTMTASGVVQIRGGSGALFNADDPATPIISDQPSSTANNWGPSSPGGGGSGGSALLQSGGHMSLRRRIRPA